MTNTITTPYDFAVQLLQVCDAALATTQGGQISRSYVSPGLPSIDCETLAVTPTALTFDAAVKQGPLAGGRKVVRGRLNLLAFSITVARDCIPVTETAAGPLPASVVQLNSASAMICEDVWAIWEAIQTSAEADELFEGRCSVLYMDNAAALATSGMTAGWVISIRTQIDGY